MADNFSPGYQDAIGALNRMIAQQEAMGNETPRGMFGGSDPVMLGLAQGLLSPTKTGSFGESIGLGLAGAQGPLEAMRKQQTAARDKLQELQLARAKLEMEAPYYQARADYNRNRASVRGMSDADIIRSIKRFEDIKTTVPPAQRQTYQDFIDDLNDELRTRRGMSGAEPTPPAKPQESTEPGLIQKGLDWLTGRGQKPQQEEPAAKPEPKTKGAEPAQPAEEPTQTESQYYTGDKPPKDQPGAVKAPDGKWYVVKEGKTYPVLNK